MGRIGSLKAKALAAPGKDGLTCAAEMVNREVLVYRILVEFSQPMYGNMAWCPQCGRRG